MQGSCSITEELQSLWRSARSELQGYVMVSCRVQSAISQGFDCFFDYKSLELDHFIAHSSERAPPAEKVAVWPVVSFTMTL